MKIRNAFLTATALACAGALASGPASAADKVNVGIDGYMSHWLGATSIEEGMYGTEMREGAVDIRSNSEIHFKGRLEADNGLTFGVRFEFEGNEGPTTMDESFAWVSGDFGRLTIGAEDSVQSLMHYSVKNAGLDLGEVRMFFPENEAYYTANWQADNKRVIYVTPRMQGVQFGVSYGPGPNEAPGHQSGGDLPNNDAETVSVALNTDHDFAGGNVALSIGYIDKGPYTHSTRGAVEATDAFNVGLRVSMSGFTFGLAHLNDDDNEREMTAAGVMYADGPMSVSGNVGVNDYAAGEASIAMLSAGYTMAPGVAVKSSLFMSESDATKVTKGNGDEVDFEGTGFVMGLSIGF